MFEKAVEGCTPSCQHQLPLLGRYAQTKTKAIAGEEERNKEEKPPQKREKKIVIMSGNRC